MTKISLGLIETWGYIPAVEAVDAGTKAADVTMLGYEVTPTGLVTVKFVGDVAAVKASVDAARISAGKVGKVVATHVIPRPDLQLAIKPPDRPPAIPKKGPTAKPSPPAGRKAERAKDQKGPPEKKAAQSARGKSSLLKKTSKTETASESTDETKVKIKGKGAAKPAKKASKSRKPKTDKKRKQSRSK
ncbi:MAG: BMC domain-containing protein [Desulfobacterales bacterium]|nr:BMC domain-containing protein [Desulfobacterales bacterium]